MKDYQKLYEERKGTLQDGLNLIRSGDVIWCSNNYNEPAVFFSHIHEIADRVENVFIYKSRIGTYPFMSDPGMKGKIRFGNYFYGPNYKQAHILGNCTFFPSDLPNYYRTTSMRQPWNVFVAQVSPMTEDGKFYIGMNQTFETPLVRDALADHKTIILEVNPNLIWMNGAVSIPVEAVSVLYEVDTRPDITPKREATPEERRAAAYAAAIIDDGDTIQMGIGGIPDAIGDELMSAKDLGIHTEQFTTSMASLIECGAATGAKKVIDKGLHVGTFADGTEELYRFLHDHPNCVLRPGEENVNPFVIASQDHMVSINTCIEMDLTGQICAESIGPVQFSGSGGGFCFALGAFYAEHGKGIMVMTSRDKKGNPKIVTFLREGAVVTHPRAYTDYVVTEYGVARLKGASVEDRAKMLISIAHPDDRDELTRRAKELHYI